MSSQMPQNYPTDVEAAVNRLASLHLRASHTYLSLGFYFDPDDVALEGLGCFFRELAEKKREGSELLLKMQNQLRGHILSRTCCSLPKVNGQNSGCHGGRPGLGEEPDPGPLGAAGPQLGDFVENHFRGEEVKLIKKMGDTLHRLLAPRLGWASIPSKSSPQA